MHLRPVVAQQPCRPGRPPAGTRPGRTTVRRSRCSISAVPQPPCSGCQPNAALFTRRNSASSTPTRKLRRRTPSGHAAGLRLLGQGQPQLAQLADRAQAEPRGEGGRAGVLAVRPDPHRRAGRAWPAARGPAAVPSPARRYAGCTASSADPPGLRPVQVRHRGQLGSGPGQHVRGLGCSPGPRCSSTCSESGATPSASVTAATSERAAACSGSSSPCRHTSTLTARLYGARRCSRPAAGPGDGPPRSRLRWPEPPA